MSTLPNYAESTFTHGGTAHRMFRRGSGRGVVLLHELPGLTAETLDFSDWLVEQGFHVVLPLLFGKPGQSARLGMLETPLLCINREFNCFRRGRSSPITEYLRALCRQVHADCGGPGVGAIGMCFTGGFVLSLMLDASLMAAVSAQPSLPLLQPDAIDISDADLVRAAQRANEAPLLALRFDQDGRCPAQRLDQLERTFRKYAAPGKDTLRRVTVPGNGHSTLTFDYQQAKDRGQDTRATVLQFLCDTLSPQI